MFLSRFQSTVICSSARLNRYYCLIQQNETRTLVRALLLGLTPTRPYRATYVYAAGSLEYPRLTRGFAGLRGPDRHQDADRLGYSRTQDFRQRIRIGTGSHLVARHEFCRDTQRPEGFNHRVFYDRARLHCEALQRGKTHCTQVPHRPIRIELYNVIALLGLLQILQSAPCSLLSFGTCICC